MSFVNIVILILSIFCLVCGIRSLNRSKDIKIEKDNQQEQIKQRKQQLEREVENLSQTKIKLVQDITDANNKIDHIYKSQKEIIDNSLKDCKRNMELACSNYSDILDRAYNDAEKLYQIKIDELNSEQESIEDEIERAKGRFMELKTQINAATEAQLREREKEEKLDFYKLSISPIDLEDIKKLESVKLMLHNPTILSKLIWSTYFQKQTTEMCNRILGPNKICGIYKITDIKNHQCYVGQSVDVAQRWKDHCKCGLGIDAPATNKLYNTMQRDGLWSFTFELLEACPREKLNEREAFWINLYQSDKTGMNSTKGNK